MSYSHSLNPSIPLNKPYSKPYSSPLYNPLYNPPLRSLDYSSYCVGLFWNNPSLRILMDGFDRHWVQGPGFQALHYPGSPLYPPPYYSSQVPPNSSSFGGESRGVALNPKPFRSLGLNPCITHYSSFHLLFHSFIPTLNPNGFRIKGAWEGKAVGGPMASGWGHPQGFKGRSPYPQGGFPWMILGMP